MPANRSFGFQSTASEVVAGLDLSNVSAIVTGASGGLGAESARALAERGARVTLTARDVAKGEAAAAQIRKSTGNARVDVMALELMSLDSVRAFAKEFSARHDRLNVLLGNAGVMACPLARTAEGWESQFATNHIGHFLLAGLLHAAARRERAVARHLGELARPPLLAGRVRGHPLRAPALRQVERLRPGEDRQRAVRGRARPPARRARRARERAPPGRHRHRARPPSHAGRHQGADVARAGRQDGVEDARAGRRDLGVGRDRARARGQGRPLPRRLPDRVASAPRRTIRAATRRMRAIPPRRGGSGPCRKSSSARRSRSRA